MRIILRKPWAGLRWSRRRANSLEMTRCILLYASDAIRWPSENCGVFMNWLMLVRRPLSRVMQPTTTVAASCWSLDKRGRAMVAEPARAVTATLGIVNQKLRRSKCSWDCVCIQRMQLALSPMEASRISCDEFHVLAISDEVSETSSSFLRVSSII